MSESATNETESPDMNRAATTKKVGGGKKKSWRRTPSHKQIHITRLTNMRDLIEARFAGKAVALANTIGKKPTFLWQLLNGYRAIGEDTARTIEDKLGLIPNSLDQDKVLAPTRVLTAHLRNGMSKSYRMVPPRSLENLASRALEKELDCRPCPFASCGPKSFYAKVANELMAELMLGDLLFVDPDDKEPQAKKLFVVSPKEGKKNVGAVMLAEKGASGWVFVYTSPKAAKLALMTAYMRKYVHIVGRVLHVVRDC